MPDIKEHKTTEDIKTRNIEIKTTQKSVKSGAEGFQSRSNVIPRQEPKSGQNRANKNSGGYSDGNRSSTVPEGTETAYDRSGRIINGEIAPDTSFTSAPGFSQGGGAGRVRSVGATLPNGAPEERTSAVIGKTQAADAGDTYTASRTGSSFDKTTTLGKKTRKGAGKLGDKTIEQITPADDVTDDDPTLESETINRTKGVLSATGAAAYASAKPLFSIPAKRSDNYKLNQKEAEETIGKLKTENVNIKQSIENERQKYKDIKSEYKNDSAKIKSAKSAYKAAEHSEKQTIKQNNKEAKKAAKHLRKAAKKVSSIKTFAAAAAGLFALVIISFVAVVMMSPLGLSFAEDDANGMSVKTAIQTLNTEFEEYVKDIEEYKEHDSLSISNCGCLYTVANWQDIFAVWDIKQLETGYVTAIENEQFNELRAVMWDMITVSYDLARYIEYVPDESGEETVAVRKKLIITVDYKTVDEMATAYSFTDTQRKDLHDLMDAPEFLEIFRSISLEAAGTGDFIPGSGELGYPTSSRTISAGYPNYSDGSYHGGVDFPVPVGTNVFAAGDGIVATVRKQNYSYGYYVIINHNNGLSTLYAHNSDIKVTEGQTVHKGDIIALSGSTGNSTGPHCHFEVRIGGNRVNPMNYIK